MVFDRLLTIEKFFFKGFLQKSKVISHIYTLFLVAVSFVIFSGNGLQEAVIRAGGLFGAGDIPLVSEGVVFAIKNYATVILVAAVCSTPLLKTLYDKLRATKVGIIIEILEIPVLLMLVIIATAYLADGSFNPFLYFRF